MHGLFSASCDCEQASLQPDARVTVGSRRRERHDSLPDDATIDGFPCSTFLLRTMLVCELLFYVTVLRALDG